MRRYWLPIENFQGSMVQIGGESFHHIIDVCRQNVGSRFEVLGDSRKAHLVEIKSISKKSATAEIIETRELPPRPRPDINICLSFSRYPVMDAVIEKAVEMGVHKILPFYSEFSFIRSPQSLSIGKVDRWNKIIQSATQQSGRGDLMQIATPVALGELFPIINPSARKLCLFAYEGRSTLGIKEALAGISPEALSTFDEVFIFVGSEGGFSSTEVELFKQMGLHPVTLGDQVLRVETACITLVAVLKYYFGQMVQN